MIFKDYFTKKIYFFISKASKIHKKLNFNKKFFRKR